MKEMIAQDAKIIVFLEPDYSDQDINNMKDAFNISIDTHLQRIGPAAKTIRDRCMKRIRRFDANFLFYFSHEGQLLEWRAF